MLHSSLMPYSLCALCPAEGENKFLMPATTIRCYFFMSAILPLAVKECQVENLQYWLRKRRLWWLGECVLWSWHHHSIFIQLFWSFFSYEIICVVETCCHQNNHILEPQVTGRTWIRIQNSCLSVLFFLWLSLILYWSYSDHICLNLLLVSFCQLSYWKQ